MGDDEQATLEGQYFDFSKFMDKERNGLTITLYRSDYWMRQAKLLDDRKLTMTETGILWNKFSKTELDYDEWLEFLSDLCALKNWDEEHVKETLTNCGLPGQTAVVVPQYREFFQTLYCNATYDTYLCWPPTPAGEVASQHCPPARLSDTSRFAFRRCGPAGLWMGRRPNETSFVGWTNYTPCFPLEVQKLLNKVYDDERDAQVNTYNDPNAKFEIAQRTRYMEIAGFSLSLVALVVSLVIFSYYRSLRNSRTRIHKSLFSAMVLQVLIRLTVYIDQELVRSWPGDHTAGDNSTLRGIDNMPYLCETSYVLLEYAVTVMFMWMFIEGLYLHNVVTANALREGISHMVYYTTGWGLPVILTALWASLSALHYKGESVNTCWYGYNFLPIYWIVQGPRLGVVVINLVFLLNIMKVLITKLRSTASTELEKIRKAVRAALVLLPLLGITNLTNMIEAPLDGSVWKFGLWSYSTHFLRSFQGFFIALIYCFLNGEVRQVITKHYSNYMAMRGNNRRHRDSILKFMSSSGDQKPVRVRNKKSDEECGESFQPQAETNIDQAAVMADKEPETI